MQTKTVIVDFGKKDKHGFKATDGNWYSNNFKTFDVLKGQTLEIQINDKGFLESIKPIGNPVVESKSIKQESIDDAIKSKTVSVMISYAKDLAVAGKIEVAKIAHQAEVFLDMHEQLSKGNFPIKAIPTVEKTVPSQELNEQEKVFKGIDSAYPDNPPQDYIGLDEYGVMK